MSRNLRYTLSLVVGLGLLVAGALAVLALLTRPSLPGEPMAQALPDVTLLDTSGAPVRLADLRGRPLLLNFWATWCPPCDEEMPALEALYLQQGGEGVQVVAVNLQEAPQMVATYLAAKGLTLPVLLDSAGELAAQLDVTYLPTTFFVDETGIIRSRVGRALTLEEMQEGVRALLRRSNLDVESTGLLRRSGSQ
ncbi:MAG TPA: TlpA disulfide reductase family protein [Anaerolineae bacterium]|nr:TlpA disulfide reductase family protein [Anaerolineae bacterium]